jgi:hypothetical protein
VLDITTPEGVLVSAAKLAKRVDLSLARSGEHFRVPDLADVARWGHFATGDYPWEILERI